ncbi:MAG: helix-turn-helix transcriptional regulator [Bacteroidota bacterium]
MKKSVLIKFGERIRQVRMDKRLSQEDLAFEVGVHRTYIGMLERAEKNPTLITLLKLSKALEIDLSQLLDNLDDDALDK